jgi:hypothetical protein
MYGNQTQDIWLPFQTKNMHFKKPLGQHLQGGSFQTSHFQSARGVSNHLVHIKQNLFSFPI